MTMIETQYSCLFKTILLHFMLENMLAAKVSGAAFGNGSKLHCVFSVQIADIGTRTVWFCHVSVEEI